MFFSGVNQVGQECVEFGRKKVKKSNKLLKGEKGMYQKSPYKSIKLFDDSSERKEKFKCGDGVEVKWQMTDGSYEDFKGIIVGYRKCKQEDCYKIKWENSQEPLKWRAYKGSIKLIDRVPFGAAKEGFASISKRVKKAHEWPKSLPVIEIRKRKSIWPKAYIKKEFEEHIALLSLCTAAVLIDKK